MIAKAAEIGKGKSLVDKGRFATRLAKAILYMLVMKTSPQKIAPKCFGDFPRIWFYYVTHV